MTESHDFDPRTIAELLTFLAATDIEELEVERGGSRLWIRRTVTAAPPRDVALKPARHEQPEAHVVAASLVGHVRLADLPPGSRVQPGQVIGRIEAMGMPSDIEAAVGGIVERWLVEDGEPVEYGQPLLVIRPAAE